MGDVSEKLVIMDEEGLHIKSPEIVEKLEKKKISASMITGLLGSSSCAARWLADTFVIREIIEEEPDNAARRGSLFHKVMEDLFALAPEERTKAKVSELAKQTIQSDEFVDMSRNKDVLMWLRDAIKGYYDMGADPTKVQIAEITMDEKRGPEKGLEVFVRGKIGNAKRDTLGFIDRLSISAKDGSSLIVEDYKSGAKIKQWKSHTKSDEGWAEQRQQLIYKILLEQKGFNVSGARLIYPVAKGIVNVDVNDQKLLDKVVADVEETDKALDIMIENNTFEYKPSFLCAWCKISSICMKADIKPYPKMQEAFQNQPPSEVLLKGIELR